MNNKLGSILRIIAIVLMGLTAAFNLLAGIGTTCVAFALKEEYKETFSGIYDYQWLYEAFVIITTLVGVLGIWTVIQLVRRKGTAYRNTLIVLLSGVIVGGIHTYASQALRGTAAPANMVCYSNVLTLLVFLLLGIPGLRSWVDFGGQAGEGDPAGGVTAFVTGAFVLTTALWIGPTHLSQAGENWVLVLQLPLNGAGLALLGGGLWSLVRNYMRLGVPEVGAVEQARL